MAEHFGPFTNADVQSLHSLGILMQGGPKLIKPSDSACRMFAEIDLRLLVSEYAQPYESTGVVIHRSVAGTKREYMTVSHWKPGLRNSSALTSTTISWFIRRSVRIMPEPSKIILG